MSASLFVVSPKVQPKCVEIGDDNSVVKRCWRKKVCKNESKLQILSNANVAFSDYHFFLILMYLKIFRRVAIGIYVPWTYLESEVRVCQIQSSIRSRKIDDSLD